MRTADPLFIPQIGGDRMRQQLLAKLMQHQSPDLFLEVVNRLSATDVEELLKKVLLQEQAAAQHLAEIRRRCKAEAAAAQKAAREFEILQLRIPWARTRQPHHLGLALYVLSGQAQIRCYEMPIEGGEIPLSIFEGGKEHQELCQAAARWFDFLGLGWTVKNRTYSAGLADVRSRCGSIFVECGNLSTPDKFLKALAHGETLLYVPWPYDFQKWSDPHAHWRGCRLLPHRIFAFLVSPRGFEVSAESVDFRELREINARDRTSLTPAVCAYLFGDKVEERPTEDVFENNASEDMF